MPSKHAVRNVRGEHAKDFVRILDRFALRRSKWEAFSDWTLFAAAAIYNRFHDDQDVEDEYLAQAKRYSSEEMREMSNLLAITTLGLEEEGGDFLGQVFEGANLANANHGQFFTPFHISQLLAELQIVGELPVDRIVTVSDPCCGAGGMILAMCEAFKARQFNFQQMAYFEAQDIDITCFRMSYIQLSLVGVAARVILGDTISAEHRRVWTTPMYEMVLMGPRLAAQIARGEDPQPIAMPPADQLELFEAANA